MTVGPGTRHELRCDVAVRARLVLNNDSAPHLRPDLFGDEARDCIGAAARWISADNVQVLCGVGLRMNVAGCHRGSDSERNVPQSHSGLSNDRRRRGAVHEMMIGTPEHTLLQISGLPR